MNKIKKSDIMKAIRAESEYQYGEGLNIPSLTLELDDMVDRIKLMSKVIDSLSSLDPIRDVVSAQKELLMGHASCVFALRRALERQIEQSWRENGEQCYKNS